jgi:hypothetical protein
MEKPKPMKLSEKEKKELDEKLKEKIKSPLAKEMKEALKKVKVTLKEEAELKEDRVLSQRTLLNKYTKLLERISDMPLEDSEDFHKYLAGISGTLSEEAGKANQVNMARVLKINSLLFGKGSLPLVRYDMIDNLINELHEKFDKKEKWRAKEAPV